MAEQQDFLQPPPPPTTWPVPWQAVDGPDDGLGARAAHLAVRAALSVTGRLPEPLLEPCLGFLARVGRRVDARHAEAARGFLRQAFGELPEAELEQRVLASYRHMIRLAVEGEQRKRAIALDRVPEHVELQVDDDARRLMESDSGAIMVSGHLGDWEACVSILPWLGFRSTYLVAKAPKNHFLARDLQADREHWGVRVLARRGAMQDVARVVRAGGAVALLLDQRARKRPVLAPFFGRPARCDRSAAVLLRRTKAPVWIMACPRLPGRLRYRLETLEVLWPDEVAAMEPWEISARINRALEGAVRRYPEQYFWLHDRFRDTPESVPDGEWGSELRSPGPVSSNAPPAAAEESP